MLRIADPLDVTDVLDVVKNTSADHPKLAAAPPAPASDSTTAPSITKKPSKWKLSFGKSSASALGRVSSVEGASPDVPVPPALMSATPSDVTSLIMGLDLVPPSAPSASVDEWPRGRRGRLPVPAGGFDPVMQRDREKYNSSQSPHSGSERDIELCKDRATSTNSKRSVASSLSSMVSGNWRSSMSTTSSTGASTFAFTRYSNGSLRSVSTTATWGSATSWRTNSSDNSEPQPLSALTPTNPGPNIPKTVKIMDGVPWELHELPRGQYSNPAGDIFGSPPVRQPRTRKPKDLLLGTIAERPPASQKSPDFPRRDAAMRTSDLSVPGPSEEVGDGLKKVSKAQVNTLAKMLSAVRR